MEFVEFSADFCQIELATVDIDVGCFVTVGRGSEREVFQAAEAVFL